MTTFKTGNPVGSTKPKDLYDNAENFDYFINGPLPYYPDRLNKLRLSWSGMEQSYKTAEAARERQFQEFLQASGYRVLGQYAAGITFTAYNQVVLYQGQAYRLSNSQSLPYTTTGVWADESSKFLLVGDAPLRQDLLDGNDLTKGVSLVGGAIRQVNGLTQLRQLPKGVAPSVRSGSGEAAAFYSLDTADTSSADNGSTVIVTAAGDRYKMNHPGFVSLLQAGCKGDGATADQVAAQALLDAAASGNFAVFVNSRTFRFTAPLNVNAGVRIFGQGCEAFVPGGLVYNAPNTRGKGAWLFFDHLGAGLNIANTVGHMSGVRLSGIGSFRNHSIPASGTFAPLQADYDIKINNADVLIDDYTMLNAYKGVILTNGGAGRLTINNMRGQPLLEGINVTESYDCCRITNVHWWTFWTMDQRVWDYQLANFIPFISIRNDNPFYENIFSIFHYIGFHIRGSSAGTSNKFKIVNADLDRCNFGFVVDSSADGATGVISQMSSQGESARTVENRGFWVQGKNCHITVDSLDLNVFEANAILVEGTGNYVEISRLRIRNFNMRANNFAAVACATGNEIRMSSRPGISGSGPRLAGAGTIRCPMDEGTMSATTDGNGSVGVLNLPFGGVPGNVQVTLNSDQPYQWATQSKVDGAFYVRFFNAAGTPLANVPVSFDWMTRA